MGSAAIKDIRMNAGFMKQFGLFFWSWNCDKKLEIAVKFLFFLIGDNTLAAIKVRNDASIDFYNIS